MIQLLYPVEALAPMITGDAGADRAQARLSDENGEKKQGNVEIFPVVQEDGTVIGRATREYCHSGVKLLHPVVHLHIIDRQERIYLQKRSAKKDIQPLKWDTAVGGHVMYGESITEALYREAREELGFTDFNPIYMGSYSYDTGRDLEFVNVFAAVGHFDLHPDLDEVDEGSYLSFAQVDKMASKGLLTPNFKSEFEALRDKLLSLL